MLNRRYERKAQRERAARAASLGKAKVIRATERALLVQLYEPLDPKVHRFWVPKFAVANDPSHVTGPRHRGWESGDMGELLVDRSWALEFELI